jgi:hypothetical protein
LLSQPTRIVYTPAHETIRRDQRINIDLNHDGITDVAIREIPWNLGGDSFFPGNSLQAEPRRAGGGIRMALKGDAAALSPGSKIGPADPFNNRATDLRRAGDWRKRPVSLARAIALNRVGEHAASLPLVIPSLTT